MTVRRPVARGVPALRPPAGMPLADYTSYEMASTLLEEGWEWRPMPTKVGKARLLPYQHVIEDGSEPSKIFYSRQILLPEYLRCLHFLILLVVENNMYIQGEFLWTKL